jgi:hypothetical protein
MHAGGIGKQKGTPRAIKSRPMAESTRNSAVTYWHYIEETSPVPSSKGSARHAGSHAISTRPRSAASPRYSPDPTNIFQFLSLWRHDRDIFIRHETNLQT